MSIVSRILFLILLCLLPLQAKAASSAWQKDEDVSVRLLSATDTVGQEKGLLLGLEVQLESGWHTYGRDPGDAGLPPSLDWAGSSNLESAELLYPVAESFNEQGLRTNGYKDRVLFPLRAKTVTPQQPLGLQTKIDILVCKDICLPKSFHLKLELPSGPFKAGAESALLEEALATLPSTEMKASISPVTSLPASQEPASPVMPLIGVLLLAFVGGFILNLMPCILPVLSLKIFGVIKHGGNDHRSIRHSFISTVGGILFSFLVLASATIMLKASGQAFGWGIQFQQPIFLVFLISVLTLFACNLFGFFELSLPRFVLDSIDPTHHPKLASDFATGALATLLATPCSAPFLGTAVTFALTAGPAEILAVFFMLGLGLSVPYLAIAARPSLAAKLPKPGPWMIWLSRALGLGLVATVAWLLYVLGSQVGPQTSRLVGSAMIFASFALGLRHANIARRLVIPFVVLMLLGALGLTTLASAPPPSIVLQSVWQRFDEPKISELVREGKTVFVDVTADWCLTCKANARFTLTREAVVERLFKRDDVVPMQADWTNPDPVITAFLRKHGRYGVPFNIVYGPNAPDGIVLPEVLTATHLLEALDKAQASDHTTCGNTPTEKTPC